MKKSALRSCSLALGLVLAGSFVARVQAEEAFTDPVGYTTIEIAGNSDTAMSLPMTREAVFAGTVTGTPGVNSFTALAGTVSPAWGPNQYQYRDATTVPVGDQPETYYVEFTSGALKGLYYKINENTVNTVTLEMEGDSLELHPLPGAATAKLVAGDSFKIRPYWRVKDVFQVGNAPIIDAWPDPDTNTDEILFPNYVVVGQNKAPNLALHFDASLNGWRAYGNTVKDYGNHVLRPNEAFIVRRRNAQPLSLTNLGAVLMNTSISFVAGGSADSGNDSYISINRPAAVSLDASGLRIADQSLSLVKDSPDPDTVEDQLLAFGPGTGFNRAANVTYYYVAGSGWRIYGGNGANVGATVFLEPGKAYILRKGRNNLGRDWVNTANY